MYHCEYCKQHLTVSFVCLYGHRFCNLGCYDNWKREEDEREERETPPVEM
jgi:hypothetical protein